MNIADKAALFGEARRVLKSGGVFAVFDVMRDGTGELRYPLPWAATAETSFPAAAATYRRLLEAAGFAVETTRSRRDFAIGFFRDLRAGAGRAGPPTLSPNLVLGADARVKGANMIANLEAGVIDPVEMICRAT
jgi:SAM-dependent methyltransferase